jgi:hypothetical protein
MSIPPFEPTGNLSVGLHPATLGEMRIRFGSNNATRQALHVRLQRIYALARATGCLSRFVVFGSYVTDKTLPNDVDVFMLMNDNFDATNLHGEQQILFDHLRAESYYGCSVFWLRRLAALGGEQAALEHWQICRDGGERGIVEVVEP